MTRLVKGGTVRLPGAEGVRPSKSSRDAVAAAMTPQSKESPEMSDSSPDLPPEVPMLPGNSTGRLSARENWPYLDDFAAQELTDALSFEEQNLIVAAGLALIEIDYLRAELDAQAVELTALRREVRQHRNVGRVLATEIMANLARRGLLFGQLQAYWSPDIEGDIRPMEDPETIESVWQFLGWLETLVKNERAAVVSVPETKP